MPSHARTFSGVSQLDRAGDLELGARFAARPKAVQLLMKLSGKRELGEELGE